MAPPLPVDDENTDMVQAAAEEEFAESVRNMLGANQEEKLNTSSGDNDDDSRSSDGNNDLECRDDNDETVDGSLGKNREPSEISDSQSSTISSQLVLDAARCSESMPSSDSNKENQDSNLMPLNYIEFDTTENAIFAEESLAEYEKTDLIPLPQLLKLHVKQIVSGFEFGEATKRRAQENMKTARDKKLSENRKSGDLSAVTEKEIEEATEMTKPCCSKTLSEREHKTPHSHKRQRLAESKANVIYTEKEFSKHTRRVPDCLQDHPDCIEVWVFMIYKEEASLKLRNPRLFNDFKSVTPRMRAILLDWLMEVAAVYHLRRVTYYLSVDYFDRFLSIRPDIPKSLLQLVGITCLYIAAKVEEIYPPNLSEFAYVCDGACKSKEMVSCELLILNSLGWEVVLTTPSDWLNLYMQFHFKSKDIVRTSLNLDFNKDFIFPQFSAYQFTRASQLMDLVSLDPGFLKFGYSVIAAAAMFYMYGEKVALSVSGLSLAQLQPCVDYMEVFYTIIKDAPDPRLHSCLGGPHPEELNRASGGSLNRLKNGPKNENYSFQTHVASMEYFEKATIHRLSRYSEQKSTENNNTEEISNNNDKSTSADPEERLDNVGDDESKEIGEDVAGLAKELASLEELTKNENVDEASNEQNLMSLDEIFELILSQDELKSGSPEQVN